MKLPKYSLHKASGRAFVKIQGKYHYLGAYGSPESKAAYAAIISGQPAPPIPAPSLSVAEMLAQFLARNPGEYPPTSDEPRQFPVALTPVAKLLGHLPACDIQAHHLADVRRSMEQSGLSRGVINRRLARIKLCFRRSELWGLIPPGVGRCDPGSAASFWVSRLTPAPATRPAGCNLQLDRRKGYSLPCGGQ